MGYFQTILFVRDFNTKKCTNRNFIVLFPNFLDSGVNFLRRKFLREMFFARTFFCVSRKKPQKSQKLEPAKNLVPHGITLKSCCQAIVREFKIGHYGQPVRLDEYWDLGRVVMRMTSSPSFTVAVLRR